MSKYFSPSKNSFYPSEFFSAYEEAGTLPEDLVEVSEEIFNEYILQPPEGKIRGVVGGMPAWVDVTPKTNSELYSIELDALNLKYKSDTNTLSASYATAALADGPNQTTKQTAIYQQYQSLKAQYISDAAALKVNYGV